MRFLPDRFTLTLIATVLLASFLPARGEFVGWLNALTIAAIALLFFIYGAKLSPQAIWTGITHWRLQGLVFATTFVVFPLIGLGIVTLTRGSLDNGLATGLMFVCLLPSTVQ
jgi:sodium/bile acid cotransporter 7